MDATATEPMSTSAVLFAVSKFRSRCSEELVLMGSVSVVLLCGAAKRVLLRLTRLPFGTDVAELLVILKADASDALLAAPLNCRRDRVIVPPVWNGVWRHRIMMPNIFKHNDNVECKYSNTPTDGSCPTAY